MEFYRGHTGQPVETVRNERIYALKKEAADKEPPEAARCLCGFSWKRRS